MTMLQSQATTVGQLLRESRAIAGLTVREIAPHLGVSFATVSAWERGVGEPSATQFVLWARATKQPLDRMIEGLSSCTPRDLNPEPIDSESIDAMFWVLVGSLESICQATPDSASRPVGA